MTKNTIHTVKINRILNECESVRTIIFKMKTSIVPKPGQFSMIWVPGIDEIPMSISFCDERGFWAITVKVVGECTKSLNNLKVGDYIGVRGPLGNNFPMPGTKNKKIFLIGGGMGMAPLKYLAHQLKQEGYEYTVIEGAKSDGDLVFVDEIHEIMCKCSEFLCCTDDGSYGEKGTTIDVFESIIKNQGVNEMKNMIVYSCGPEKMMYKLFNICKDFNIEYYASLERIMRCGCGICGLCSLDPLGLLVCKDGPVFNSMDLNNIGDFGNFKRDFTGRKVILD
ncbi:MAG: dihydroorotate dehydrogenase electron transfer subunit [Promethearchaeota archaeon]